MKKNMSIRIKIIALMISCLLLSIFVIGGVGLMSMKNISDADSLKIMNLLSENKANEIDSVLTRIEQAVHSLSKYTANHIDNSRLSDSAYITEISTQLSDIALNEASNTEGCDSVYVRFNHELTSPTAGFFYSRDPLNQQFVAQQTTDISKHAENDRGHVGWYYEPMRNQESTWLDVYYNKNIDLEMISYVVPIYHDQTFLGVVGMDINFSVLKEVIHNTKFYNTGYAFLTNGNADIIYHKDLDQYTSLFTCLGGEMKALAENIVANKSADKLYDYTMKKQPKKLAYRTLTNGMRLLVTAPTSEIDEQFNHLILQINIFASLIIILFIGITILFVRRLISPLIELTQAAKRIAKMDLGITIKHHSNDEVGVLAESFRETVDHLRDYINYINSLAYRDPLTGLKNKTAYVSVISDIDASMQIENQRFAVIVFDMNELKTINDTYGHVEGDQLINQACSLISRVYDNSSIYRIGGDEFVIILQGYEYNHRHQLLKDLNSEIQHYNESTELLYHISIAHGMIDYDKEIDTCFQDVFKRADSAMYHNKMDMKRKK